MENRAKKIIQLLFPIYLIALAFTVFTPKEYSFHEHKSFLYRISAFFQPFHENTFGWTLGNLLLLAPLGVMLLFLFNRLTIINISLICFATSGVIELSQNLVATRVPDLGTVMINGIGATLCTLFVDRMKREHAL